MIGVKGQRKAILEHLKKKGSITSMEAFSLYGVTRLSAIIFDFRKSGYVIKSNMQVAHTRYGTTCNYAKYILDIGEENKDNE